MVYPPDLLDRLQAVAPAPWTGVAFRHMFASYPPDLENTRGARWNPPGTAAIYLSLSRAGVLAEAEHQLSLQAPRPAVRRTVYEIEVTLANVLDLGDRHQLAELGISRDELEDDAMTDCQNLGGAVEWLGHDGLLVPSARSDATNLVIYPTHRAPDAMFLIRSEEDIT